MVGRGIAALAAPALVLSAGCYGLALFSFSRQLRRGLGAGRVAAAAEDEAAPDSP